MRVYAEVKFVDRVQVQCDDAKERKTGCSSCHIPYGNEGYYEGKNPTINKTEQGHMLTHKIQATPKTKVTHSDVEYSGIPVETCNSCHNRGKRIGVTYQGLMEFPYGSPYSAKGGKQPRLHTTLAMHRNKVSDAYVVFLFDHYAVVKELLQSAMRTLVYGPIGPSAKETTRVIGDPS